MAKGHLHAIGQEGDKDVRFNARLAPVENGPQAQVAFEIPEGFLNVAELYIELPESGRRVSAEIAAQQITTFASPRFAELFAVDFEMKSLLINGLTGARKMDIHQPIGSLLLKALFVALAQPRTGSPWATAVTI